MTTPTERYAAFHDPFAEGNVVGPSDVFPNAKHLSSLHIDAPPPYSNAAKPVLKVVSAKPVSDDSGDDPSITYNGAVKLDTHGQGTVVVNCGSPNRLLFTFSTEDISKSSLYVEVTETTINFWYGRTPMNGTSGFLPSDRVEIKGNVMHLSEHASQTQTYLHSHDFEARYWVSVDHKNGILRFGRDYTNYSLALYEARLKKEENPDWSDENYKFIDSLSTASVQQQGSNFKNPAKFQIVCQPYPIVERPTPIIVSSDSITLDQMANGSATVAANLSAECQRLYSNVAGANIALDDKDFPEFTQAIERSVNTEGLLCWNLLQKKAHKPNDKNTYLRITIGADLGNSPGAPYVLEIWPDGHSSPIHDHGKAHAVIKVLHGKIKAYYFTELHDAQPLGPPANLQKGDVTWLDPENYQVHQLSNESGDKSVCCTIQCYSYGKTDTTHYENFDYIDQDKKIVRQFRPNSDMRFDVFKKEIKKEWYAYKLSIL